MDEKGVSRDHRKNAFVRFSANRSQHLIRYVDEVDPLSTRSSKLHLPVVPVLSLHKSSFLMA